MKPTGSARLAALAEPGLGGHDVAGTRDHVAVPPRILIVDDDPILVEVVSRYLRRHGMETSWVASGSAALEAVERRTPDLVVLDVMLPGRGGHAVCQDLQARFDVPVLMLTALGNEDARVAGLESGADDYVSKPVSSRELLLRIRALLRRARRSPLALPELLSDGRLSVDLARRQARLDDQVVPLTAREQDLLVFLMRHPGVAFTRQSLLERVWGWSHGDLSTVTVHVRRLREKIEDDPAHPLRLQTVFGVGYRYEYDQHLR
jgi:DNA-binding response OmpR family regulator